jgi:hypothetical protein
LQYFKNNNHLYTNVNIKNFVSDKDFGIKFVNDDDSNIEFIVSNNGIEDVEIETSVHIYRCLRC